MVVFSATLVFGIVWVGLKYGFLVNSKLSPADKSFPHTAHFKNKKAIKAWAKATAIKHSNRTFKNVICIVVAIVVALAVKRRVSCQLFLFFAALAPLLVKNAMALPALALLGASAHLIEAGGVILGELAAASGVLCLATVVAFAMLQTYK